MKMHIKEFAVLTGVSVRTLHYYDEIGLLKPSYVDEQNGYRFYDEHSLERMQEIMFYRELDFSLKSIAEILSSENYDKQKALTEQKQLLILKKERLERLISALDSAAKGDYTMNMNVFDNSEFEAAREKYAREAKEKWGNTDAYKESKEKSSNYSKEKWNEVNNEMNGIISEFAELMKNGAKPYDSDVQETVKKWQDCITRNYYSCTKEILAGLGEMYTADERFKENIDKHGEGTAEFISRAIKVYCS
ncbi:MAG: MerR family transcriptional regulator [Oscillospiraceae bacterium]|nr:MerR family transcriptional regulator [Oscillospiraceae bacterium]